MAKAATKKGAAPPISPTGINPMLLKLDRFVAFTDEERSALEQLSRNPRFQAGGIDLIAEGDKPGAIFLLMEGWGFRYKQLADGKRQIMAYLIPGDLCDIQMFLFEKMDHSIGLLCDAQVVRIPAAEMLEIMDRFPRIQRALMWATLVDEATLREWLLNVGQRNAVQRISHLFCELCVRLSVVKLVSEDESFTLPLTQMQLADTTGMTTVHVNRTLQYLRKEGLIVMRRGELTIQNFEKLAAIAGFDANYLHTDGPPTEEAIRLAQTTPR
ncbi:MAG: Crp/Fnr family transcriptional regulator [Sphingomicrobium sp.]